MSCSLIIRQNFNDFTSSEKKIAEYILENPGEIYKLSAQELANLTETSSASIVRFARKLGFSGFQEFKIELAKEETSHHHNTLIDYEDITPDDSIRDLITKIGRKNINTIEQTLTLLDEAQMQEAIESILKAKHIYLFGVGGSALVAMDLQQKLARISRAVFMHLDTHLQLSSASHITSEDLAIGISYSGKTSEVYRAISAAKERGAKCISITKYGTTPLSEISDINLKVPNIEGDLRLGAISSRIAQLTIVDILFIGVARKDFDRVEDFLRSTRKLVEGHKLK